MKKYILPRFQSILTGPDRIYNGSETTSYTICGKYSYGRHVKGVALLAGKINHGWMKQPTTFSKVKDVRKFNSDLNRYIVGVNKV